MELTKNRYLKIMALGVAGGSMYLIPFIRYVFYDWQIESMQISNAQLGFLTTVYAIANAFLYIPAGILADKFSTKKLMVFSLTGVSILTWLFAFNSGSYGFALFIWVMFALVGVLPFWCALFKTIRLVAGEKDQGFLFGLYYMCNGLTGAIANAVGLKLAGMADSVDKKFFIAVVVYGFATALGALLILLLIKNNKPARAKGAPPVEDPDAFKISQLGELVRMPVVWVFSIVVFTGYAIYSSSPYFTPYLTDVVGISPEDSGVLSIIRTYIFYILAPVSGMIADKIFKSTSKWFIFLYLILTALFLGVLAIPSSASVTFVSFYTLLPGLFGLALYGIIFSIANEAKIPVALMGTAVGVASLIGYSPDFFMATMFGSWLDKFGSSGYNYIFIFLGINCFVGFLASVFIRFRTKKVNVEES